MFVSSVRFKTNLLLTASALFANACGSSGSGTNPSGQDPGYTSAQGSQGALGGFTTSGNGTSTTGNQGFGPSGTSTTTNASTSTSSTGATNTVGATGNTAGGNSSTNAVTGAGTGGFMSDGSSIGGSSSTGGVGGTDASGTGGTDASGTGGTDAGGTGGTDAGGTGGTDAGGTGGTDAGGTGGTDAGGTGGTDAGGSHFRVSGRHLYDRCGEQVVLRGVNEMVVWSGGKDGVPEFSEIGKTGANSVRIVWNDEGNAAELDTAITNAVAEQLIPMVEHHGATGDLSGVPAVVDYWTQSDVVTVLKKHEAYLLLNIANEAGASETNGNFDSTYRTAISRIRDTGVLMPLVIDAPQWGQDIDMLQAVGPDLIEHDPEHNLLFSVHMWWSDPSGTRVISELNESVNQGLPLIIGEFAQHAVSGCDDSPFGYTVLLAEAQKHQIGWLAWSWGGVNNSDCADQGSFDMTVGGVFGDWEETWGEAVALTDPNSIQNTSVRPGSMLSGSCD